MARAKKPRVVATTITAPSSPGGAPTVAVVRRPPANKPKKKPAPFVPQRTGFAPPRLCWDIVWANRRAAAALGSWRWLWVLPQVFGRLPFAEPMARWLCDAAAIRIWKKKANALFALTDKELQAVPFEAVAARYGAYDVHLMQRADVLALALAKHGGTLAGVNAAFLARREARDARRKRKMEKRRAAHNYYYHDYDY
jgi:hypothetical protein